MKYESFPQEVRAIDQWVCWRAVEKPDGRTSKVPINPKTGGNAKTNDETTWGTFEEALAGVQDHDLTGIGFVLTDNDPYAVIDLDGPYEGLDDISRLHERVYNGMKSYSERSPSGDGLHIWIKGLVPKGKRNFRSAQIDVYSEGQFITVTGERFGPFQIEDRQEDLRRIVQELDGVQTYGTVTKTSPETATDDQIIQKARSAKNGEKFWYLWTGNWNEQYPSQSDADLALMNILAFYTQSESQLKHLFRSSGLGQREKASRDDYLDTTIGKALQQLHPYSNEAREHGAQISNNLLGRTSSNIAFSSKRKRKIRHISNFEIHEPEYLVDGLIEKQTFAVVFGASESGKSLFIQDLSACLVTGRPFFERECKKSTVAYVAAEGSGGIALRFKAWGKHRNGNLDRDAPLYIITPSIDMLNTGDVDAVIGEIETELPSNPDVVVLDTLARNFGEGNENQTDDMNRFVNNVGAIMNQFDCTVIVIHHSGHEEKSRARGSSALRAAADSEFKIQKIKDDGIEVSHTKSKDGPKSKPLTFDLEKVDIGKRKNGDPFGSVVLVERVSSNVDGSQTLNSSARLVVDAYVQAAATDGVWDGTDFLGLADGPWIEKICMMKRDTQTDYKTDSAKKLLKRSLGKIGYFQKQGDLYVPTGGYLLSLKLQIEALRNRSDIRTSPGHPGTCPDGEAEGQRTDKDTPL